MDFLGFLNWATTQPWSFAVPYAAATLIDWAVGSVQAYQEGVFKKERVFDWVKTTVGWQRGMAVVGSVALAYFLNGQHDAYVALVPLVAINGPAFLVVLADIKEKLVEMLYPPKAPVKVEPPAPTPVTLA